MKKAVLILITLVPVIAGWLINLSITIPSIGMLVYYVLPLAVLFFWFWLGKQYAGTDWNLGQSLLIGNATGLVSLGLYIWQFVFRTDETRNMFIAALSQMFGASVPGFLCSWLAIMFETQPGNIGGASTLAYQVIAVVIMIAVFACGFLRGKRNR